MIELLGYVTGYAIGLYIVYRVVVKPIYLRVRGKITSEE